jgi:hypothetical protein
MDTTEAADLIREIQEDRAEEEASERFRSRAALAISVLAVLLAVASLGGDNAGEEIVTSNIQASDTWAFYQAKNIRQTANRLAADGLEANLLLVHGSDMSEAARRDLEGKVQKYRATADRYENEPDPEAPDDPLRGEGKKQLSAKARSLEAQRDRAQEQDASFDYSSILFQIAIVLGSVAILATSRRVFITSLVLGAVATLLMLNGFFLFVPLSF